DVSSTGATLQRGGGSPTRSERARDVRGLDAGGTDSDMRTAALTQPHKIWRELREAEVPRQNRLPLPVYTTDLSSSGLHELEEPVLQFSA
ncbi:hypothetical protein Pmar_PMAR003753, partial [Perkinsus marinus ATCC 50983]